MDLFQSAKKYFHKGFVDFDYVTDETGYVTVKDGTGKFYKQMVYIQDNRMMFGPIEGVEYKDLDSKEILNTSINVRISKGEKDDFTKFANQRGMKASEYARFIIENEIIRLKKVEKQGYEIIES
ncbi:hypothetical protein IAI10_16510 [Clostridium sp. 19966]|uniref:hypothetical protein n=1 Tax=Clostridium sp. 19966 TaxID=2768166 RepID=UPI0028DE3C79|nr:hypothetical protein [Clostridium sp. 19966]MDT8718271.1 hypothetical protein [Clostridium sp. 19966]